MPAILVDFLLFSCEFVSLLEFLISKMDVASPFLWEWVRREAFLGWCSEMSANGIHNPERRVLCSEFKLPSPHPLCSAFKTRQWRSRTHCRGDLSSQLNSDVTFSPERHFKMCSHCIVYAGGTRHLLLGVLVLCRLMYSTGHWTVVLRMLHVWVFGITLFCLLSVCGSGVSDHSSVFFTIGNIDQK